ncbi:hypothetical protein C1645_878063, partial [Glomus cerebriforme]
MVRVNFFPFIHMAFLQSSCIGLYISHLHMLYALIFRNFFYCLFRTLRTSHAFCFLIIRMRRKNQQR